MSSMTLSSSDNQEDYIPSLNILPTNQLYLFIDDLSLINTPNDYGWTPLYRSIISSNHQATIELLQQGADPNQVNSMGETALYQSVEMELVPQTKTLLSFNADPNLAKNDGMTPLHCAVKKCNKELVSLLLEYKAQPDIPNRLYNQTALHIAVKSNTPIDIIDLLIQYKASLTIKDKYGKTPLDYADLSNEELMTHLNDAISVLSNEPSPLTSPLSNKVFTHAISSTSYAKSANINQYSIKKVPTSNFLISTPKEDTSTNTYHENNVFTLENGLASFYTCNSKKQELGSNKDIISDISPLELGMNSPNKSAGINVNASASASASHIFSELQENSNSMSNRVNTNTNTHNNVNEVELKSSSKTLNDIDISDIPIVSSKKNKNDEEEGNSPWRKVNHSNPQVTKGLKKTKQVKISYHRSNNIHKDSSTTNTTIMTNANTYINDNNKENNANLVNIKQSKPSDYYYSSENPTDYDTNNKVTKGNKLTSRLYSINSTRVQTHSQTQPTIPVHNEKDNIDKIHSLLDNYITKENDTSQSHYHNRNNSKHRYAFNEVKPLYEWLSSIDLLCYFNTFTSNEVYEIEPWITQLRKGEIDLSFKDFEDFGIRKPGHIYRLILKARIDSNFFNQTLIAYLFPCDTNDNQSNNILRLSKDSTVCNGCFTISKTTLSKDIDLGSWLNLIGLPHLKENFIHNGFELVNYILLQMFSNDLAFTDESIIEYLHIYNITDRKRLLRELLIEKKKICTKLNIEFNDVICDDDNESNCQMCIIF